MNRWPGFGSKLHFFIVKSIIVAGWLFIFISAICREAYYQFVSFQEISKYLFHSISDSSLYIFRQHTLRSILRFSPQFLLYFPSFRYQYWPDPTCDLWPVTCDLWLVSPPAKSHQLTPSYYPKLVVHDAVATHHPVDILLFPISY